MRHRVKVRKLNRSQGHYRATIANLASSLLEHKQIKTTLAKAKELRPYIEKLITHAKTDSVHKRRVVYKKLNNRQIVFELFTVIGPKNLDRDGGYTRILKLGQRRGDGTEMALIQLVGFEAFGQPTSKKKTAKKAAVKEEKPLLDLDETSADSTKKTADEPVIDAEAVEEAPVADEKETVAETEEVKEVADELPANSVEEVAEVEIEADTKAEEAKAEEPGDEDPKAKPAKDNKEK